MEQKIKNIIKKSLKIDVVPDDISQETCDKWDSLAHLILIQDLESALNIRFELSEIRMISSLKELLRVIENMCVRKGL